MKTLCLLTILALPLTAAAQLPQAPLPPQAPPVRDELVQVPLKYAYREASQHAVSAGKPLIVGLRCVAPHSTGEWVSCNVDVLEGYTGQGILVCTPDGKGWIAALPVPGGGYLLPPNATRDDIRAALKQPLQQAPQVQQYYQPVQFGGFRGGFRSGGC